MRIPDLENLDVAILGAGHEGRAAWRAIRRHSGTLPLTIYCEAAPEGVFANAFNSRHDQLLVGPLDGAALARHDVLVRSPGISPYREELRAARRAGVEFTTATELWFNEHAQARTLCITGTKGKSTTAALTAHLLEAAGVRAQLGGNIGEPLLDCTGANPDWWVIELSSYQLADLRAQPSIAVILNVSDAHLAWHGGPEAYRRDKLRIAELAGERPLVVNHADEELRSRFGNRPGVTWFNRAGGYHVEGRVLRHAGIEITHLPLPGLAGAHNLANLAAALTAVELTGTQVPDLPGGLRGFAALPHRLQVLGRRAGLQFVNDSLSTTPVATLAALRTFAGSPVTLLLGGEASRVDWSGPAAAMRDCAPHAIITLPDSGPQLASLLQAAGVEPAAGVHSAASLAEAVELAKSMTPAGGAVLLSPGAPSFPQFRSYAERGERFAALAGFEVGQGGKGQP
jgi:UDP-N-acetylmuramoylalanine--D-glutamate ligase